LIQRFQLAVYPDVSKQWRNVDRRADIEARAEVHELIEKIANSSGDEARDYQFSDAAQDIFDSWRFDLETRIRSGTEHPMLEAHLSKYRSLVPSLALLLEIAERASVSFDGSVREDSVFRAIGWTNYLESHAKRIYAPAISPDLDSARALATHIVSGGIGDRFSLRDIYRHGWSGLSTRDDVLAAIRILVDYDWLREHVEPTTGRNKTVYELNPSLLGEKQ
jgi:putative DNA primase/helicase